MKPNNIHRLTSLFLALFMVSMTACKDNLPEDMDALGEDVNYTLKEFEPILGRKTEYQAPVYVGNTSSLPLNFKIVNPRSTEGDPASELTDKFAVKVWTAAYTGAEKTLAEIEAKRKIEYRPMLDIQEKSGNIFFWNSGSAAFVKTQPDSGYIFDVEISNSGGKKYARNLRVKPMKERPYEPSIYSAISGIATNSWVSPSIVRNLYGEKTGFFVYDIQVFFHKDVTNKTPGNSLTFSVLDSLNNSIDIREFDKTDWTKVIHGFDHTFHDGKVTYQVAYPMPLVVYPTEYTNSQGSRAEAYFSFDRIGEGGFNQEGGLGIDFAIFEEGHWEIQFRFRGETPTFEDEI